MSTADDTPREDAALPPDPDSLRGMFHAPAVRNYLFAGLAALAMVFVVLFSRGSDLGGLLLVVLGAAGLVLRWPAAPVLFLLILTYFLVFPFGFPTPDADPYELLEGRFRVADLILVAAVVVYLAVHYRLYGLTTQAVPAETRSAPRAEKPPRRPPDLIRDGEIVRLLYLTAGVVIVGQVVWAFLTSVEVDVLASFPLRLADRPWVRGVPDDMPPPLTRFVVLNGLLVFGTLLARLVFGYWGLRRMSAAEGGMILQDAGWDETRRERVRVEQWRACGRERAAKQAADGGGPPGEKTR
jgi:hypothetical protein